MPAAQLKDYYKILEISPDATAPEVKKAFRAMAFKYHPDTCPGDAFAAAYFMDVQEAYTILGDEVKREKYDHDRWLAGMADRARTKEHVSPMWVLKEAIKLNNHMATVDVYRMNHKALHDYILQLLNDNHIAVLTRSEEPSVNEGIINMIVQATRGLKYVYMRPVADRLMVLAGSDIACQASITKGVKARQQDAQWARRTPYIIVCITLLLVFCMYLWARK